MHVHVGLSVTNVVFYRYPTNATSPTSAIHGVVERRRIEGADQ